MTEIPRTWPSRPCRKKIAVVGSGAAGLSAAWALRGAHDVTMFEAADRLGGHSHTIDLDCPGGQSSFDIGFIVFTPARYPNFTRLLDTLGVASTPTTMGYGYSVENGVEWSTTVLGGGFVAQKRRAMDPRHLRMISSMIRFAMTAERELERGLPDALPLSAWLRERRFGRAFERQFLLPMAGAIWSACEEEILAHDAQSFLRFFIAHGLTDFARPEWRTLDNNSRDYVQRIAATIPDIRLNSPVRRVLRSPGGATVDAGKGPERFDEVILACHSDQALAMLADADMEERQFLGAIRFRPNRAVLHSDPRLAPARPRALACWNARRPAPDAPCYYTYDLNRLQHLTVDQQIYLTLNPPFEPDPGLTWGEYEFDHPVFAEASYPAQRRFNRIQGVRHTWFAGAWLGYGFHEDAVRSGLRVGLRLGGEIPWDFAEGDVCGGPFGARPAEAVLERRAQ